MFFSKTILFVSKTSSRRLQDMSSKRLQDMFSRRLEDVFSVTIFRLPRRLQDFFKTSSEMSSRRLCNTSSRRLQYVLEEENLLCWRRVEDVFKTCLQDVLRTSWTPTNVCWDVALNAPKTTSTYHFKAFFRHLHYNVVLSTIRWCCSGILIATSFYQQYNDVFITILFYQQYHDLVLTSFNRRRFYNIATMSWYRGTTSLRKNSYLTTSLRRRVSIGLYLESLPIRKFTLFSLSFVFKLSMKGLDFLGFLFK